MRDDLTQPAELQPTWAGTLSPQGHARKAEILGAMHRAASRRRVRVRSTRAAALLVVCCAGALLAWLGLAPPVKQPLAATGSGQALPAPEITVPERRQPVSLVVEYIKPEPGIADRFSKLSTSGQAVTAQRLTEAALSEVLAGQQTYGLAQIRGQVLVFDNQARAEARMTVH